MPLTTAVPFDVLRNDTDVDGDADTDARDAEALYVLLEEKVVPAFYDASLAPEGKGVIKVILNASYRFWRDLRDDPARYAEAKTELAEELSRRDSAPAGLERRRKPGPRPAAPGCVPISVMQKSSEMKLSRKSKKIKRPWEEPGSIFP